MIDRKQAWGRLAAHIADEIVVATYSSATDWLATVDSGQTEGDGLPGALDLALLFVE